MKDSGTDLQIPPMAYLLARNRIPTFYVNGSPMRDYIAKEGVEQTMHITFERLLEECLELHKQKDSDYAGKEPYSNFMVSAKFGERPDRAVMVRLSDKFERVCTLLCKEKNNEAPAVSDEKLEDTLRDLLNYAGMMIVVRSILRERGELV